MSSEEVGVLRKLGKQAVWLLRRISAGEIVGGAENEPDVGAGEEDEESGEGEEECMEDGASFPDAEDADDGYSLSIGPITTTALGQNGDSEAHPPATKSDTDTDIAKAKQRILDSLRNSPSTRPVTEPEADGERGLTESADERKAMIHGTLDMLVTIIGEFYGQRDLLDGRLLWDEVQ